MLSSAGSKGGLHRRLVSLGFLAKGGLHRRLARMAGFWSLVRRIVCMCWPHRCRLRGLRWPWTAIEWLDMQNGRMRLSAGARQDGLQRQWLVAVRRALNITKRRFTDSRPRKQAKQTANRPIQQQRGESSHEAEDATQRTNIALDRFQLCVREIVCQTSSSEGCKAAARLPRL